MTKTNKNIHLLYSEAGFSLMETLVAVFILSIVSLISLNIMSNFATANQTLTKTIAHIEEIKNAQNYIRNDMRYIVRRTTQYDDNKDARVSFSGKNDPSFVTKANILLRFTRNNSILADIDQSLVATETVEYRFEEGKLFRRSFDRPNPTFDTPYREYVILHNVENIDLKFLIGGNWVDEWQGVYNSTNSYLPRAIEISWNFSDSPDQLKHKYVSKFKLGANL